MSEILIVLLSLLLGASFTVAPAATSELAIPSPEPMPINELGEWLDEMQSILDDISPTWYLGHVTNGETFTQVAWIESCCLGVITFHETRFYNEADIAGYFDYDNDMQAFYEFMLTNYAPYELKHVCELDGIRIHLFKGTNDDYEYYIRHFHQEDSLTTLNTGLYFRSLEELDMYSQLFFPDITCPSEDSL